MPLPPPAPAAPPAVAEPLMGPPPPMLGMPAGITGPKLEFPEGDMFFYVENDGRHVVALDGEGKLKWRREPFVEYPARGERLSPITSLTTPGYDAGTGRRVLLVKSATGFRGLEMISGDYLMG